MAIIKIYNTKITPTKNMWVESIDEYLATCDKTYEANDFQYQKISLTMTIKVNINQEYVGNKIGNYLSINQDARDYYFFITNARWTSKECVALEIALDTINTYASELVFDKKTTIHRQHKDRVKLNRSIAQITLSDISDPTALTSRVGKEIYMSDPNSSTQAMLVKILTTELDGDRGLIEVEKISGNAIEYQPDEVVQFLNASTEVCNAAIVDCDWLNKDRTLTRIIDMRSEGATPVLYHNVREDKDILDPKQDVNWYLIYASHTTSENAAVDCYMTTDTPLQVKFPTNDFTINPTDLEDNKYYYLPLNAGLTDNNGVYHKCSNYDQGGLTRQNVVLHKTGAGTMEIIHTKWISRGTYTEYNYTISTYTEITSVVLDTTASSFNLGKSSNLTGSGNQTTFVPYDTVNQAFSNPGYTVSQLKDIKNLDRTDARIIKIIKLPYCPSDYIIDVNGVIRFEDDMWNYVGTGDYIGLLKLDTIDSSFDHQIVSAENPFSVLTLEAPDVFNKEALRDDKYESKLYHSDFYIPKMCYDSFNLGFALEKVDLEDNNINDFRVNFIPTTTINSKFLFEFPQYIQKYATEDYPNIITVSRNNEITIYNDQYINYIKTGYNYDVKNKNRSTIANWVGTGISLAGGVAGIAAGAFTGGLSAAAGISLLTSAASSIANNINSTISQETAIEQKLAQYQNQSASVSGSDDIDLMSHYTHNRLSVKYYKISQTLKQDFADLFYYCGYADNSQEVPNLNSRFWFNYIQCDAVFYEVYTEAYESYLSDIKARFAVGITVYHKRNNIWDLDQHYENWEMSIL